MMVTKPQIPNVQKVVVEIVKVARYNLIMRY